MLVDQNGDITIKLKEFPGSGGLWELFTRKRVNKEHVTLDDMRTYENITTDERSHFGISNRRCH